MRPAIAHQGFWSFPRGVAAWTSVFASALAIAYGASVPQLHSFLNERFCPGSMCAGGRELIGGALVLSVAASAFGLFAVTGAHERSVLVVGSLALTILVTLFWTRFALAEVLAAH